MNIQYVTDSDGNKIAVQIGLEQWDALCAELEQMEDALDVSDARKILEEIGGQDTISWEALKQELRI
jgi:hypothetical protein